jgi:hypothetical protein
MKQSSRTIIQEGIEEYHYETVGRVEEEREMMREYDKYEEALYKKKFDIKSNLIKNFKSQNQNDICNKCFAKDCGLLDEIFGCGYIGKKLELDYGKENITYNIVDTPKGVWDEIFVPLTDQQINNFTAIL